MPQRGLENFIMYSVETSFCCSFQASSSHGYPQFLYWKSRNLLWLVLKMNPGRFFFHWLFSGRGTFFPSEFKRGLMREGSWFCFVKIPWLEQVWSLKALLFQVIGFFWLRIKCKASNAARNYTMLFPETMFCLTPNPCNCELLLLKRDCCIQSYVLSQLAPPFFFISVQVNLQPCSLVELIQRKGKECIKYKKKLWIWSTTSIINWDTKRMQLRKWNLFFKTPHHHHHFWV